MLRGELGDEKANVGSSRVENAISSVIASDVRKARPRVDLAFLKANGEHGCLIIVEPEYA